MFKRRRIFRHFYSYPDDERKAFGPRCMLGWKEAEDLKVAQSLLGYREAHTQALNESSVILVTVARQCRNFVPWAEKRPPGARGEVTLHSLRAISFSFASFAVMGIK